MSTVYKKLTAQDIAVVPFNAHKQYNFTSGSASANSIKSFNTEWTSESIDIYSGNSGSDDSINAIKYRQLDHLFYKNFKRDISNRFGNNHYLNQRRELHKDVNILSIPAGLYGFEIKPGSFYLSSSLNVIDDNNGNLIISGTNLDDYETDIRSNVLNLGPVKGFEKYDLNTLDNYITFNGYEKSVFYRDGKRRVNKLSSYNSPILGDEFDDSYYFNIVKYKDVNFSEKSLFENSKFPGIDFNGVTSEVKFGNSENYNFNPGEDFSISFWVNMYKTTSKIGVGEMEIGNNFEVGPGSDSAYLVSKSTTKTVSKQVNTPIGTPAELSLTGSFQPQDVLAEVQFPFEIFVQDDPNTGTNTPHLFFQRSDGDITSTVSASFTTGSLQHVTCLVSNSEMRLFINGNQKGSTKLDASKNQTQNQANLYIGNKGGKTSYLTGSISQLNILTKALTGTKVRTFTSSSNGSPYVGNIFYQNGLVTITHPRYNSILNTPGIGEMEIGDSFFVGNTNLNLLKFQGSHLIFENEYQCTVDEFEFNSTTNISARKYRTRQTEDLANFATGSLFSPYVTTIGLYNENNELLVVGKLGQPVRMSNETDTTFVLRWDT